MLGIPNFENRRTPEPRLAGLGEGRKFTSIAAVRHGNKFETDFVNIPHIKARGEGLIIWIVLRDHMG